MKTNIFLLLFMSLTTYCLAGDIGYQSPADITTHYDNMHLLLESYSTEDIMNTFNQVNGNDSTTYEHLIPYHLPVLCDILIERNAVESLPALKNLALQPAGNGDGALYYPISKAAQTVVLLENNRFEYKSNLQKAKTIIDLMSRNTTAEPNASPLVSGLNNIMNVRQWGCIDLMIGLIPHHENEILPLLDKYLNSNNPVMRSFSRNAYPRKKLIEKLHLSMNSTINLQ